MENHYRAISWALIYKLVILIKDSLRGGDTAAERVIILIFIKGLIIVLMKDVYSKKRTIERSIAAFYKLSYPLEGLKERACLL